MKVSYNGYIGFQNPTRLPKWVNSADYATLYNEALTNDGLAMNGSVLSIQGYRLIGQRHQLPETNNGNKREDNAE